MVTLTGILSKRVLLKVLCAGAVFALLVGFVNLTAGVVASLFLIALLWGLDSAIPLGAALVLLLASPLFLLLNQKSAAENLAVWAYYFLAIGVLLQLIDYVKTGSVEEDETGSTRSGTAG